VVVGTWDESRRIVEGGITITGTSTGIRGLRICRLGVIRIISVRLHAVKEQMWYKSCDRENLTTRLEHPRYTNGNVDSTCSSMLEASPSHWRTL
jgi:hypothetical protein